MRHVLYIKSSLGTFAAAVIVTLVTSVTPSQALSGSQFNAGRIIDNFVFSNKNTMSARDIQEFLNAKVPVCDTNGTQDSTRWNSSAGRYYTRAEWGDLNGEPAPFVCLKNYWENPITKENNLRGEPIPAGAKSAAQLIADVSNEYNINPQVLLVLLQKEQSIVTDDWPWTVQYRSATGYGCPDTAPCDADYYGFYNQISNAAWQFNYYASNPASYSYRAGFTNYIQFNPVASCGGSDVFLQNQATTNLYIYTPYQPNSAALNNLYGSGDSCSAYGNRNFWRMFNDWFGTTYANDTNVAHPNGTLVYDEIGIWLINNGQRSFFKWPQVIDSYNYNWKKIKKATTGDKSLPFGPELDKFAPGTIFTYPSSPNVYIMDYDTDGVLKKRHITAYAFRELGYKDSDVRLVPAYTVPTATFSMALDKPLHPSGTIVLFYGIPTVYVVDKGMLRPIENELSFDSNNFRMSNLKGGTQFDSWLPKGPVLQARQGTVVLNSQGISLIDYDLEGKIMARPFGPWECYADRMHYTSYDWINNYQSLQLPKNIGPTFSC